jgi:hypothetical protein
MLLDAVIDIQPEIHKNLLFHRQLEQRHTAQNELNKSNQESPNKSMQESPSVSDLETTRSNRSPSSIGTNTAIHNWDEINSCVRIVKKYIYVIFNLY